MHEVSSLKVALTKTFIHRNDLYIIIFSGIQPFILTGMKGLQENNDNNNSDNNDDDDYCNKSSFETLSINSVSSPVLYCTQIHTSM